MSDKVLNVYKGTEKLASGVSPVHVDLSAGEYIAGTFSGSFTENGVESKKVDFPAVTIAEAVPKAEVVEDVKPTAKQTVAEITAWLDAHKIDHTGVTIKDDLLKKVPVE